MSKCERNQKHQTSLNNYAERSYILCKDNAIFRKTTILLLSKTIKNHRISITKQNLYIIKGTMSLTKSLKVLLITNKFNNFTTAIPLVVQQYEMAIVHIATLNE